MNIGQKLALYTIIFVILAREGILLAFVVSRTLKDLALYSVSVTLLISSLLVNPIIFISFAKSYTILPPCRFWLNSLLTFPFMFMGTNVLLYINPRLTLKHMECLGVNRSSAGFYTIVWIFYGKLITTCMIDTLLQMLVIGIGTKYAQDPHLLTKLFFVSGVLVLATVMVFSMGCCLGVILPYLSQYGGRDCFREKPTLSILDSTELLSQACAVCLDEFIQSDAIVAISQCSHTFHEKCIDNWLIQKESCPVCRVSLHQPE